MYWKEKLQELENKKEWDTAIKLMQKVIEDNPNNLDAYLSMNYLLMNLLVEENYNFSMHDYYEELLKKCFVDSYAKFSDNPEYLFYMSIIAEISYPYLNLDVNIVNEIIKKASNLDTENMLYQWRYYLNLDKDNPENKKKSVAYAKKILKEEASIKKLLKSKGSLGEYVLFQITTQAKMRINDKLVEYRGP